MANGIVSYSAAFLGIFNHSREISYRLVCPIKLYCTKLSVTFIIIFPKNIIINLTIIKVGFAVLKAINTIPFLSSLLEIIGIAYVSWFICRYLLSAANRQDLALQVKSFKEQTFGTNP
ncbi:CAAD domain-containing protein [Coleofasciculus sp.]|uniref:CAAD domain-containing protein n=1 Tax=Coleofasciculus sp. TaxID=3100458 RepID=UPI003A479F30